MRLTSIRIASVSCGSIWSQTFSYDPFGNIEKSGSMLFMPSYSWQTNHITGIGNFTATYDANGNVTNDGLNTFSWDTNGRPTTADGATLTYDALGRMVEQHNNGAYTEIVYGPTGAKLGLMNGQTIEKAFVALPAAGATAVYNSSGLEYYRRADWLGSSRLTSTPSRTVSGDVAYAPFGETYAQSGSPDLTFTGQNADTNANLYDFMYREYGIQGRWPSPDPLGPGAFNLADPQTLDLYAYVRNSPTGATDPLGLNQCRGGKCPPWLSGGGFDPASMFYLDNGGDYDGFDIFDLIDPNSFYNLYFSKWFTSSDWIPWNVQYTGLFVIPCKGAIGTYCQVSVTKTFSTWNEYAQWPTYVNSLFGALNALMYQAEEVASATGNTLANVLKAPRFLHGGNWNFYLPNTPEPSDCATGVGGDRCGTIPSLHFITSGAHAGYVHLDSANANFPLPLLGVGDLIHLVLDVLLGNTIFSSGNPW